MSRLVLSLLGPPGVQLDGAPVELKRRKPLALLAYLAVTARSHSRDALAEMLYPGHAREQGYSDFRETLTTLRRAIGEEWIIADRSDVHLADGNGLLVDVVAFRRLVGEARSRDRTGHRDGSMRQLARAAALVRGRFLEGFSVKDSPGFLDWQAAVEETLRGDGAWVLQRTVEQYESGEKYREAIDACRSWLSLDSCDEAVHRRLMQLYARSGQRSRAIRQYQRCRAILEREIGEKPDGETEELRARIAAQGVTSVGTRKPAPLPATAAVPKDPFPFVGREGEMAHLQAAFEQSRGGRGRMVMLVGEAGIGKTRLLEEAVQQAQAAGARVAWGRC